MKIYLVRHAQSIENTGVVLQRDTPLSETGKEQARRLGVYFEKAKIDIIFCSELKRAKETLDYITPYIKKPKIVYSPEIKEHNMGTYFESQTDYHKFRKDAETSKKGFYEFKPKGGESLTDVFERQKKFYKSLLKKDLRKNILIVGHGQSGAMLILNILGLDISEEKYFKLNNASVSTFNIGKKGKVEEFHVNDFNHILKEGIKKNGKK
jgi:broad specificity phosphatase PhoE